MTEATDQAPSQAFGSRYEISNDTLGQGATGAVRLAWDRQTSQPVAAKFLWPHFAHDTDILSHFIGEKTLLTSLHHPNIVAVTDLVYENDQLAIIMDVMQGPSLARLLQAHGTLAANVAVPIIIAMLDGLAYAHEHTIVHRDVKPDNILFASPQCTIPTDVRLADFGIAHLARDATAQGRGGTPNYMPPEVINTGQAGPAADIYSTGIVLYELLGGRTPFAGPGQIITLQLRHLTSAPPQLPISPELWAIIAAMLAKDPSDRPSASEAAARLRALPSTALTDQALPVQPVPTSWEAASARTGSHSTPHENANPTTDPNATGVMANRRLKSRPTPDIATDSAQVLGNQTQVHAPTHHNLGADIGGAPASKRRTPLIIAIAATVVIIAVVLALWLTGTLARLLAPPPTTIDITTTASHLLGETAPSGLRIDYDAAYNSQTRHTDLDLTLSATSGLQGDILIVVPPLQTADACPTVTSPDVALQPVKASSDGLALDCAYKLTDLSISSSPSTTVTLDVDLNLISADNTFPENYTSWLTALTQATQTGLDQTSGTLFPLQRVTGITFAAEDVTLDSNQGTPLTYTVTADWAGDQAASPPTVILTPDTLNGSETSLLLALTGGAGLDATTLDTCSAVLKTGIRLTATQPTDSCAIQVQIGAFTSRPATLRVNMR